MAGEGRFQVAAGAIIQHRRSNKVLLIHRSQSQYGGGIWEFPIGRLSQFETFEEGLRREVFEETGISDLVIGGPLSTFDFMRGEHSEENEVRAVVFTAQTKNQDVQLSKEHDAFKWLLIDEAIELATHPGIKRDLSLFAVSFKPS